jgi:thioredoxin 1
MSGITELEESGFEQATGNGLSVVDFGAEWCSPCRAMIPILEKVATQYADRVRFYSVDIDQAPSLSARNGVMSVPTMLLFMDGRAVSRIVGTITERELKNRIDEHFGQHQ